MSQMKRKVITHYDSPHQFEPLLPAEAVVAPLLELASDLTRKATKLEGPWADRPMLDLILHINREVIHHGAEIACVRDLYVHQKGA